MKAWWRSFKRAIGWFDVVTDHCAVCGIRRLCYDVHDGHLVCPECWK